MRVGVEHRAQRRVAFALARLRLGLGGRRRFGRRRRRCSLERRRGRRLDARHLAFALLGAEKRHRAHLAPHLGPVVGVGEQAQPLAQLGLERHRLDALLRRHAPVGLDVRDADAGERRQRRFGVVDHPRHEPRRPARREVQVVALALVGEQLHRETRVQPAGDLAVVDQPPRRAAEHAFVGHHVDGAELPVLPAVRCGDAFHHHGDLEQLSRRHRWAVVRVRHGVAGSLAQAWQRRGRDNPAGTAATARRGRPPPTPRLESAAFRTEPTRRPTAPPRRHAMLDTPATAAPAPRPAGPVVRVAPPR